uniref:RNA dependent RNA polymerase n=1 Tax=Cowpea mild mottle virus TaxID=67761 RepID=A0A411EZL0_9VIRU|nr:RNA dependent RNA polymerase [Cowpea mild mottle virus]
MALTYRTPMEDIVSSFEPAMQSAIASKAALSYKALEEKNFQVFNFHLKAEAKQKLSAAGVYLSPFSAVVHSHPVCKTLENHILYSVLPNYVNNKFFFVGIKNSKINLLKSRDPKLSVISVINRYVTSKDVCRYSNDFVVRSSKEITGLSRHRATLAEATLRDLVPNLLNIKAKHLFMHDELHYWREKDLITFLEVVNPEVLLATVVYPPELLVGSKQSLNPWCYDFNIKGNKLLFYPDGVRSEGYEQPLKGGYLLTAKEIHLPNGEVYCVDLIHSKYAHHLISITKGAAVTCEYRSFDGFEAVAFGGLINLSSNSNPFFQVSFDLVSKMYRYLRSLKKPDLQSAMAKLSQIVPEPSASEIKFVQEFADLVMSCSNVNSLLSVNKLRFFLCRVYQKVFPAWCLNKFSLIKELCLDDFISQLKPFSFTKKTKIINLSYVEEMLDWSEFDVNESKDLPSIIDEEFSYNSALGGSKNSQFFHLSQPYIGLAPLSDASTGVKAEFLIPRKVLVQGLTRVVMNSLVDQSLLNISEDRVKSVLVTLLENRSILLNSRVCFQDDLMTEISCSVKARVVRLAAKVKFESCLSWFQAFRCHRVHSKYLTNYSESSVLPKEASNAWASVVRDLREGLVKLPFTLHEWSEKTKELGSGRANVEGGVTKTSFKKEEVDCQPDLLAVDSSTLDRFGLAGLSQEELKAAGLLIPSESDIEVTDSRVKEVREGESESESAESTASLIEGFEGENSEHSEVKRESGKDSRVSLIVKDMQNYSILQEDVDMLGLIATYLGYLKSEIANRLESIGLFNLSSVLSSDDQIFEFIESISLLFSINLIVILGAPRDQGWRLLAIERANPNEASGTLWIQEDGDHFKSVIPKNLCVIQAVSKALKRRSDEVINVLAQNDFRDLYSDLMQGKGLELAKLEQVFEIFSIHAFVQVGTELLEINKEGSCCACFDLREQHVEYIGATLNQVGCPLTSGSSSKHEFENKVLLHLQGVGSEVVFKPKISRAKLLADCLHSGSTGVISSELFNGKPHLLNSLLENESSRSTKVSKHASNLKIIAVLGTFGVGKSSLFKQMTAGARGQTFDFVSPRRALLDEIRRDLKVGEDAKQRQRRGQQNWFFNTFEKFLGRCGKLKENQLIFVDEVQLFPSGYLDLITYLIRVPVNLIVFGDPCQSDYDNEKDRDLLGSISTNVEALLKDRDYKYNILSHRFQNGNFLGRLPCLMDEERFGQVSENYLIYNDLEDLTILPLEYAQVILVSSFEEKRVVSSYVPEAKRILTFGESTGLNFDYGTILITMISERSNEKRWVTALSRFRRNLALVNSTGLSIDGLALTYKDRFLGRFLCGKADPEQLRVLLPGRPIFTEGFQTRIGRDEGIREEKLAGDPWLKSMVDLFQIEDVQVEELQEITQQVEEFKIHLPREEMEGTRARWVHKILNKEFREVRMGSIVSDQFTDDHSKQRGGQQLTNAAERFETIYPRHRANDTVTFIMAVKKRLRFSKPHVEKAKLSVALPFGRFLLNKFLDFVPLKRAHNVAMMDAARQEFFDKKTSKSAATIENHNIRSCRDWLADVVQVFSKSQICTKFDNRFRVAKAAQSIACFQHSVLCRFAPYMRYIEKKLQEALPKRFYIHSGKSLEQLNTWVLNSGFDGLCTESDYEAFDASQDQYIVAFEIELMKYLGLPNDLIQDYLYIKTHLGSKLGSFAIMRFTGEASTFLFNTMASMLFTFLRYQIKGNENICFAGDDMCSSKKLTVSNEYDNFLKKIKLKAKVQHTLNPTFCGWHLSPDGIYKKPQLVFERMCIAKETNNLQNCIDSYAIEVSYAYKMGERVTARMDEEELGAYYGCVRTIIKYKHLLKSDVKALYESLE